MSLYVYTTTGTRPYLTNYLKEKHVLHNFTLMQKTNASDIYLLLDETDAASVFNAPFGYENRFQYGEKPHDGVAVFEHIGLAPENEKSFLLQFEKIKTGLEEQPGLAALYLLRSEKKTAYVVLTFWTSDIYFNKWTKSEQFKPLIPYITDHQTRSSDITYADTFQLR
ncbi:antibiotic biosynthesis monooxygenase family protein [Carnobacterium gallinarum]|uniref:antibiotic biosynthesis monooxygenase family protein n=1 Tax=Carnobacterium gallinarum TaxID=2749 RepID=UPI0005521E96|nr:antibiotic biosynthesis monooxygenase [Carnobacterium gallinarum]